MSRPERMTAREANAAAQYVQPEGRVNLDAGTAAFMGYEFPLTSDSIESIKIILAAEVCLILEIERERVIHSVQHTKVSEPASSGGENVPEVSGPEGAVEPAPQT